MVSIRRHSRWMGPLGPAMESPLHVDPVEVQSSGGDEPVCFLPDINLTEPPPIPRGRGRGRPRGRGRGRGRGGGGGGLFHGHYKCGRVRKWRQVPRGLLLRKDLSPDPKSLVVLALASPEPKNANRIAASATCNRSNIKEGSQDSCVYLREGRSHETVQFATPIDICEVVPLLDFGGGSTPKDIGEQPQKGQPNRTAEQPDILWWRDGNMIEAKAREASQGKRKCINYPNDKNKPKKALAKKLENTWAWEVAAHREMLENISSRIKSHVEAFKKGLGDVFVVPYFDPPPDKYDGAPGVILRVTDITDTSEQDFFTYVKQDMETLQGLANAETIDMGALSRQINKILAHWTRLFSSHINGGTAEMIQALNDLKGLVASDAVTPLPFDAAGATAYKTRVEEGLKEAAALHESIPGALTEICQVEAAAHVKCNDLAALKEKQKKKIARLKASLASAEKSLKEIENEETETEQLLEESEAARQDSSRHYNDLKKTIDSGELAKSQVQKYMQYIGVGLNSTQPKPVRSLISYMQSSSCEG